MDDDGSKSLCRAEFEKACRDFKVEINNDDIGTLFQAFDINRDGTIQYDEFLRMIRGELTENRLKLALAAFKKLDRDCNGQIEVSDIEGIYNAKKHPAVLEGRKTE
jgi:Ca2+-binding EF-hand superfamily protein